jgi:hypothetical protein
MDSQGHTISDYQEAWVSPAMRDYITKSLRLQPMTVTEEVVFGLERIVDSVGGIDDIRRIVLDERTGGIEGFLKRLKKYFWKQYRAEGSIDPVTLSGHSMAEVRGAFKSSELRDQIKRILEL